MKRALMLLFAGCTIAWSGACRGPGEEIESWETGSPALHVRVRQFNERHTVVLPHSYFSLESKPAGSDHWKEVMRWVLDDPGPIQREHVQFVADSIAYAFGHTNYVVTTDSGKTWSEWDAKKALPNPAACAIQKVQISDDGTGNMVVWWRRTHENGGLSDLGTTDFGVHWTLKNETSRQ